MNSLAVVSLTFLLPDNLPPLVLLLYASFLYVFSLGFCPLLESVSDLSSTACVIFLYSVLLNSPPFLKANGLQCFCESYTYYSSII